MLFRINREGFYLGFVSTNALELPPATYLLNKHLSEVLSAEVTQLAMDKIEQALNTNTIQTAEYQLLINGGWHQYEARIVPIKTDEVLAIIRDISDYKRAEEDLPKSEAQFQKLIDIAWQQYFRSG
jgi:PAS domain-containing protein